jgi:hypothetical protein
VGYFTNPLFNVKLKLISADLLFLPWPILGSNPSMLRNNVKKTVFRITNSITVFVEVSGNAVPLHEQYYTNVGSLHIKYLRSSSPYFNPNLPRTYVGEYQYTR